MRRPLAIALLMGLTAAAPPPVVQDRARNPARSPLLLDLASDLTTVCGNSKDVANQLICVSWLNGASQINARFQTLSPQILPDFCPPPQAATLGRQRELLLGWLAANPKEAGNPALMAYRKAMAGAFPCQAA
ncbi:Rap1a/Tai family immunity protein [Sandarakinorhabdus rubra]|uniref:Rap1a/Tai family immunity protein n=1 Tax=Sandarakinorhabdus rubra TaxID=2672568 RepID=UPI0013DC4B76|nr:Rap1a/Tai family immunity protein [Sandarakinorhabdus rubra]